MYEIKFCIHGNFDNARNVILQFIINCDQLIFCNLSNHTNYEKIKNPMTSIQFPCFLSNIN